MKNAITQISRILVGLLFIVSGLIKLNDPVGFSYKLAEYFSESVLNLPFLVPLALPLAVSIVIFEAVLGFMLLIGYKPKFTVWSLLLLIVFFTFLTFYSAYNKVVTDCGCFGDALKLTPWQSFTKDVVLLFFIIILFINQKLIRPFLPKNITNVLVYLSIALCAYMGYFVLNHLPIIDFRAYKVGTNIPKAMEIPEGAPKAVVEMKFIYNVGGVNKEYTVEEVGKVPADAKFVDRIDKVISEGYVPPVHDFTIEKDGEDHASQLMAEPKLMTFIMYELEKADADGLEKLAALAKSATAKGYKVIAMTSSGQDKVAAVRQKYSLPFDFYFTDATTLKTIERANPSIVIFNNGTIVQKVHFNDIDSLNL
jgi:uncharacterized membrane protein YphA (DoxX/SURF4 family)